MDSCKLCCIDKPPCSLVEGSYTLLRVECPRCGTYNIDDRTLSHEPDPFIKERLYLISAVARWNSERGNVFTVKPLLLRDRSEFEAGILSMCPHNKQEIMNHILTYIAEKTPYTGAWITINKELDYPLFYCENKEALQFYIGHLEFLTLIGSDQSGDENLWKGRLSGYGWIRVEELAKTNIESTQAFVAMWFTDETNSAYSEGIAELEEDTGFSMLRIDMKQFNEKICDRIIAEIRKSRFLIADVTGHRQGVYFEAGYAMGLGLPVIWTCREDQIYECHFDTRQYNHITWTNASELHEKLKNRILATIGEAPKE